MNPLLSHELTHFLLSLLAAGAVVLVVPKKKRTKTIVSLIFLGALLGEFFLDADHLIDYAIAFGLSFHLDAFLNGSMFYKAHQTFVLFHGWEWIIVLAIITRFIKNTYIKFFLLAVTTGLLFHLVYDMFYNHFTFLGYSLIYRIFHGFQVKYFSRMPQN